jgi:hypothetical protein
MAKNLKTFQTSLGFFDLDRRAFDEGRLGKPVY